MTIFEIDNSIRALMEGAVDAETGEVLDADELLAQYKELAMAREEKIDNTIRYFKETLALAKALADEIKALTERKRVLENKAERTKKLIETVMAGEKYTSAAGAISYRGSESAEPDDQFIEWAEKNAPELLKVEIKADKTAIKEAIKAGKTVEHAEIVKKQNIQIK